MLCTILPVLYLSMLFPPLGLRKMAAPCQSPEGARSGSAIIGYDSVYIRLSRRLDRCDRVIQNESGDPNGGNMCSFTGATCTSRVRHDANYVPYAQIRFDL